MECKAVIFDLFETLITEWGHPKYTKKKMCSDPGIDQVVLSYETGMQKPDSRIYQTAVKLLGVVSDECVFVGDGGSSELEGAKAVGMRAIQAKWYTNQHPHRRDSIEGFLTAEQPLDVLQYISG